MMNVMMQCVMRRKYHVVFPARHKVYFKLQLFIFPNFVCSYEVQDKQWLQIQILF